MPGTPWKWDTLAVGTVLIKEERKQERKGNEAITTEKTPL
jgi:hypothetical protein